MWCSKTKTMPKKSKADIVDVVAVRSSDDCVNPAKGWFLTVYARARRR